MKIYTAKPSQVELKYHEEQVHYNLDGTSEYNWRKIQKQIKILEEISAMPENLDFTTDKVEFEELNNFSWLKSDFKLPILNNEFIEIVTTDQNFEFASYPVKIINKRNAEQMNLQFSAFYIKSYFDCVDRSNSPIIIYGGVEYYDYWTASFRQDIEYPSLFKIIDVSTPYMHFVTEEYKNKFEDLKLLGFDLTNVSTIK